MAIDAGDPMQVLGLKPGFTLQKLESSYRRLSKLLHPDKCPLRRPEDRDAMFILLTDSYTKLKDRLEGRAGSRGDGDGDEGGGIGSGRRRGADPNVDRGTFDDLRSGSKAAISQQQQQSASSAPSVPSSMMGADGRFNVARLNQIFEQFRVRTEQDAGYDDWMQTNSAYDEQDGSARQRQQRLKRFDEGARAPRALVSSTASYTELGADLGDDGFTGGGGELAYTDYRNAYTTDHRLIDIATVAPRREFASVEELRQHRASLSMAIEPDVQAAYDAEKAADAARESRRLRALEERDGHAAAQFELACDALLGPGRGKRLIAAAQAV